jgi:hypothetical protein
MAKLIQAISTYGPRVRLGDAIDSQRFTELIIRRTTLASGLVKGVQESQVEALIDLLGEGRPVHTGIAIFTPTVDLQGNIGVSVRLNKRILRALNSPNGFTGKITNKANTGKSSREIVDLWNKEHPDDPVA